MHSNIVELRQLSTNCMVTMMMKLQNRFL